MSLPEFPYIEEPLTHNHDRGLTADLEAARILNRRRALGFLGAASGAAFLTACGGDDTAVSSGTVITTTPTPSPSATSTPTPTATSSSSSCTTYANETNGPYPADGTNQSRGSTSNVLQISSFQRQDIRSSVIGSSTLASGVNTELTLTFVDVNSSCSPLVGWAIYVWHCDALGQYSLYDLPDESYLRGIQVTDSNGQVTFQTIFPGCYSGRYPHIHFEAFSSLANATSASYARLISQFAMPADACNAVYALSGYGNSSSNFGRISISSDNVFGDNSAAQITAMTMAIEGSASAGYSARATIGIAT